MVKILNTILYIYLDKYKNEKHFNKIKYVIRLMILSDSIKSKDIYNFIRDLGDENVVDKFIYILKEEEFNKKFIN